MFYLCSSYVLLVLFVFGSFRDRTRSSAKRNLIYYYYDYYYYAVTRDIIRGLSAVSFAVSRTIIRGLPRYNPRSPALSSAVSRAIIRGLPRYHVFRAIIVAVRGHPRRGPARDRHLRSYLELHGRTVKFWLQDYWRAMVVARAQ